MYKTPPEKIWRKATVVKYLRHKSYDINSEDGGVYTTANSNTPSHTHQNILKVANNCLTHQHSSPWQQGPRGLCKHLTEWTCELTDESKVNFGTVELGTTHGIMINEHVLSQSNLFDASNLCITIKIRKNWVNFCDNIRCTSTLW